MKEFKGREERTACYEARDAYFDCCEKLPEDSDCKKICQSQFENFQKTCGIKWTEHFLRKHKYLKFKERLQTEGISALDGNFTKSDKV